MQLAFGTAARIAPGLTERIATHLFRRPQRSRRPPVPQVPGLAAEQLRIHSGRYLLAGWAWGAGPTIALVHGWNGHAAQMAPFVAPLVAAGYRVVAYDQPAQGYSSGRTATLLDMRQALWDVAAQAGPLHGVVAHSLGGTATALALAQGLRVERAVLVAPPAELPYFVSVFARMLGLPPARDAGLLARILASVGMRDATAFDLRRAAPARPAPLLVLHDTADREVPFAHGRAVAEAWAGAFVPLSGLGHRRMLADPTTVEAIVRFVVEDAARQRIPA